MFIFINDAAASAIWKIIGRRKQEISYQHRLASNRKPLINQLHPPKSKKSFRKHIEIIDWKWNQSLHHLPYDIEAKMHINRKLKAAENERENEEEENEITHAIGYERKKCLQSISENIGEKIIIFRQKIINSVKPEAINEIFRENHQWKKLR